MSVSLPSFVFCFVFFFFFNETATTEIYTLSLHDALPISWLPVSRFRRARGRHRPRADLEVHRGDARNRRRALLNAPDITTTKGSARPRHHRRAARLCATPVRGGGAH